MEIKIALGIIFVIIALLACTIWSEFYYNHILASECIAASKQWVGDNCVAGPN